MNSAPEIITRATGKCWGRTGFAGLPDVAYGAVAWRAGGRPHIG